jgi:hypothetical protein
VNQVVADAGSDRTAQFGEKVKLTAKGGDRYEWSTGEKSQTILVDAAETREYSVRVFKGNCFDEDKVAVKVNQSSHNYVSADAGQDITICPGESVVLTASGGSIFNWSTGQTSQSIEVWPSETTIYSVEVSDGVHSDVDEVEVEVIKMDNVTAGSDRIINKGESIELEAEGGDSYHWSTGEKTKKIKVSPNKTKKYEVEIFKNGCSTLASVQVEVKEAGADDMIFADAGEDVFICPGEKVVLQGNGSHLIQWNTGDTSPIIEVQPLRTTSYVLRSYYGDQYVEDTVVVHVENCEQQYNNKSQEIKLVAYPNPSNGLINVDISGSSEALTLNVFDLNGRLLLEKDIKSSYSSRNEQLELTRLPKGVYFVKLFNANHNETVKILLI